MQSSENNRSVLGILGGGQLGRMLIQEAISFDQDIYVLDPDPHAPCSKLATNFFWVILKIMKRYFLLEGESII
jgi:phosphoribosylaminoimidazole carboxylase (NCAIR synthetase)